MKRVLAVGAGAVLAVAAAGYGGLQVLGATTGDTHHGRTRTLAASVRHLTVRTDLGHITLASITAERATMTSTIESSVVDPDAAVRRRGHRVAISANCPGYLGSASCKVSFTVRVPAGVSIAAHTTSGDITGRGLGPSAVTVSTSSGDIKLSFTDGPRSATMKTTSGDIALAFAAAPRSVAATATSGDIYIKVPRNRAAYRTRVHTSSGDRKVRVRTDPDATHSIRAHTNSGDITIAYRQPR
jgi:hypothetical protein